MTRYWVSVNTFEEDGMTYVLQQAYRKPAPTLLVPTGHHRAVPVTELLHDGDPR